MNNTTAEQIAEAGRAAFTLHGEYATLTRRWETECDRCGQPIETGAVTSSQHGCGGWNVPSTVDVRLADYPTLAAAVLAGLTELRETIADEIADETHRIADDLQRQLVDVMAEHAALVADGLDDDDADQSVGIILDGMTPGVSRDGDKFIAWAWTPQDTNEPTGDCITVSATR